MRSSHHIGIIAVGVALAMMAAASPAQEAHGAQAAQSARNAAPCVVFASDGLGGRIIAACRGHGIILGEAESFAVQQNPGLEATVIDLVWSGEHRVMMISFPDGEPLLEELTGDLAKAAGRGPMTSLEGLVIDLSTFARDGEIGVSAPLEAGKSGRINLGQQIASEKARQGLSVQN